MLLKKWGKKDEKTIYPKIIYNKLLCGQFFDSFFSSLRASIKHTKFLFDVVVFYPHTLIAN